MLPSAYLSRILPLPPDHGCEMMERGSPRLSEVEGAPCHSRNANIPLNAKRGWKLMSLALHQTSEQTQTSYKHGHQDILICSFTRLTISDHPQHAGIVLPALSSYKMKKIGALPSRNPLSRGAPPAGRRVGEETWRRLSYSGSRN